MSRRCDLALSQMAPGARSCREPGLIRPGHGQCAVGTKLMDGTLWCSLSSDHIPCVISPVTKLIHDSTFVDSSVNRRHQSSVV